MRTRVTDDELHHIALPKLFGAPAYARPPIEPVARADRPFDPDELPLESEMTEEERRLAAQLAGRPYGGGAATDAVEQASPGSAIPDARPSRLRSIGRLLGGNGSTPASATAAPTPSATPADRGAVPDASVASDTGPSEEPEGVAVAVGTAGVTAADRQPDDQAEATG